MVSCRESLPSHVGVNPSPSIPSSLSPKTPSSLCPKTPSSLSPKTPSSLKDLEWEDQEWKNQEWKDIPVIIVTAKTLSNEDRALLNGSVQMLIHKDGDEIETILNQLNEIVPSSGSSDA